MYRHNTQIAWTNNPKNWTDRMMRGVGTGRLSDYKGLLMLGGFGLGLSGLSVQLRGQMRMMVPGMVKAGEHVQGARMIIMIKYFCIDERCR